MATECPWQARGSAGRELVRRGRQSPERLALPSERPAVFTAEVNDPACTALHSCASTSLAQKVTPQANSHPRCQSHANQGPSSCGRGARLVPGRLLHLLSRGPSSPSLSPQGQGSLQPQPACRCREEGRVDIALDPQAPPAEPSLASVIRTLLGIRSILVSGGSSRTLRSPLIPGAFPLF